MSKVVPTTGFNMPRCQPVLLFAAALLLASFGGRGWLTKRPAVAQPSKNICWNPTLVTHVAKPPGIPAARLPHPMPDGHIDRDVQILVEDRQVTIDVRMAASDVTWIEIIRLAESRTDAALAQHPAALPAEVTDAADQQQTEQQPLPTTEEAVAAWLVHDPNRKQLERWLASTCRLEWDAAVVPLTTGVTSRPDSRHHWSITFQLKYTLSGTNEAGELRWKQVAYQDYPGKVRRALKTRGESLIDATDVSPLVVRAEFEVRDKDSTQEQRQEHITAQLRLPPN